MSSMLIKSMLSNLVLNGSQSDLQEWEPHESFVIHVLTHCRLLVPHRGWMSHCRHWCALHPCPLVNRGE